MAATVKLREMPDHEPGWTLVVDGKVVSTHDWRVESRFGSLENVVVPGAGFDRPGYRESPNTNLVVYGIDDDGQCRIAVLRQPRPHADDPLQPGVDGHDPVVFGQTPMGFIGKVLGVEIQGGETLEQALERIANEEAGVRYVKRVTYPAYPHHNPNPTFVETWSDLAFVEVDLKTVGRIRHDRREPIFNAEFVTAAEFIKRIRDGVDGDGAVYRGCTSNSVWLIFFATFPEFWPR